VIIHLDLLAARRSANVPWNLTGHGIFATAESKLRRSQNSFYQNRPVALAAFRRIGLGPLHFLYAAGI
jgi:hypothetical protein